MSLSIGLAKNSGELTKNTASLNRLMENDLNSQIDFTTKLFLTQLQNQIPGDETDVNEMVRTIMGMMTAAQQVKTNKLLEDGNNIHSALYSTSMTNFEGDMVEYIGNNFFYQGQPQQIVCNMPTGIEEAILTLYNESGQKIRTFPLNRASGRQVIKWDGTDNGDEAVSNGNYIAHVEALDAQGKRVEIPLSLNSVVTAVYYDENNLPVLIAGGREIREIERHHKTNRPIGVYPEQKPAWIDAEL